MTISRRDFLKYCGVSAAVLGLSGTDLLRLEQVLADPNDPTVLWLHGSSCSGCSVSFLNYVAASEPTDAGKVLMNHINLAYHPVLMAPAGLPAFQAAEAAYNAGGYVLVVEGAVAPQEASFYCGCLDSPGDIGGGERVLFEQTTRLAKKGHRVYLITRRLPEHGGQAQETICGVHEVRCRFDARNPARLVTETWLEVRRQVVQLHDRIRFDIINIHQPITACGAMRAAGARKIPMVYSCHSLSAEEYISRNAGCGPANRLLFPLNAVARKGTERRVLRSCDRAITLSRPCWRRAASTLVSTRWRCIICSPCTQWCRRHARFSPGSASWRRGRR